MTENDTYDCSYVISREAVVDLLSVIDCSRLTVKETQPPKSVGVNVCLFSGLQTLILISITIIIRRKRKKKKKKKKGVFPDFLKQTKSVARTI